MEVARTTVTKKFSSRLGPHFLWNPPVLIGFLIWVGLMHP